MGTRYCLCCNEEVPINTIEREDGTEITCVNCGFTLDTQRIPEKERLLKESYALIADDSKYTRKIIEDLIREKGFSARTLCFENGLELVSEYSRLLAEGSLISLAILDLNMPVMDGLTTARTMRTIETSNNAQKTPIVFFSGSKADESLKSQMEALAPANYVNKGNDPDPDKLAARVEYLLSYMVGTSPI